MTIACHQPVHRLALRVYYEDTDAGGVVYHPRYLHFAERARTEWLRTGWPRQSADLRDQGMAFVVHHLNATYHRPARLDQLVVVSSWLHQHRPSRLIMTQQIHRADEQPSGALSAGQQAMVGNAGDVGSSGDSAKTLLVSLSVTLALVKLDSGKPQRLPDWLVGG